MIIGTVWLSSLHLIADFIRWHPNLVSWIIILSFRRWAARRVCFWEGRNKKALTIDLRRDCLGLGCEDSFRFSCCKLYFKKLYWVHSSSSCMPGPVRGNHCQVGVFCGLTEIVACILTVEKSVVFYCCYSCETIISGKHRICLQCCCLTAATKATGEYLFHLWSRRKHNIVSGVPVSWWILFMYGPPARKHSDRERCTSVAISLMNLNL